MHQSMKRCLAVALLALVTFASAAWAEGDVSVQLTAHRVQTNANGKETLVPGDQAHPGDVLEYRATYTNSSGARVRQLAATLPVPQGMEYLAGSASPAPVLASLDGRTFEAVPLKRKVRLADGRTAVREVPASEYRWLRWSIPALEAKSDRVVKARVRVAPIAVAALTR